MSNHSTLTLKGFGGLGEAMKVHKKEPKGLPQTTIAKPKMVPRQEATTDALGEYRWEQIPETGESLKIVDYLGNVPVYG